MGLGSKAQEIYTRLLEKFGLTEWRLPLDAMDELISTILSQNTNDRNRDVAFNALKNKFSTWELVREADLQDVINCIRPAGLANQKGARIQAVLREITAERGNLDLSFLKNLRSPGCAFVVNPFQRSWTQNRCHRDAICPWNSCISSGYTYLQG